MSETHVCPISGSPMDPVFSALVLQKYNVVYYYCSECGFLTTEKPYWLEEAYRSAISELDTGLVSRNLHNSALLEVLLKALCLQDPKIVDVAGGYGLLTRLMRDKGFDCYNADKYCPNILARGFEPSDDLKADALFAFEVLEHLDQPIECCAEWFKTYACRTLILSTATFNGAIPTKEWWYYAFEGGQHIAFYQPRTLSFLAKRLGCSYVMLDSNFHVITDLKIPKMRIGFARSVTRSKRLRNIAARFYESNRAEVSWAWQDHLKLKAHYESAKSKSSISQPATPSLIPEGN